MNKNTGDINKITFEEAFHLLEESSAVIWGDGFLCYAGLRDEEQDDPDKDVFLKLSAEDSVGRIYESVFCRDNNKEVSVIGTSMFLTNDDGEEEQLTLLFPQDLFGNMKEEREKFLENCRKNAIDNPTTPM
jgi:hypothetical protein